MNHSMPGLPVHHQLPESTQTHVHWVGDAILPSIFPSIRVFSNRSALHIRWPKYWSFSFSSIWLLFMCLLNVKLQDRNGGYQFCPMPVFCPAHLLLLLTSCLTNFRLAYPVSSITWANFTKSSFLPSFFPFLLLPLFLPLLSLSFCLSFSLCLFSPIYLISLEFEH